MLVLLPLPVLLLMSPARPRVPPLAPPVANPCRAKTADAREAPVDTCLVAPAVANQRGRLSQAA